MEQQSFTLAKNVVRVFRELQFTLASSACTDDVPTETVNSETLYDVRYDGHASLVDRESISGFGA